MSKFNTTTKQTIKTTNLAGGKAYSQSSELELVSLLLTSFMQDQYYEKASDQLTRLKDLINKCNPKFVAQAAIYARTVYGMRSITHVTASELAKHIGGEKWAKNFYDKIVYRVDDMMEIMSYHKTNNGKFSGAMKKGFAKAFDKFTKYQLAKYRAAGKAFKLIDVVNVVHPKPTEGNEEAIAALVKGDLKSFDTWESALTEAGQTGETAAEKLELKKGAWTKLIKEKKLGYLGLLRNLRNISEQAPEALPAALESLTSREFIKKSLIFPFQYLIAYKQFEKLNTKESRLITKALSEAIDISCDNVKDLNFTGNTLVAIDNSGSMDSPVTKSEHMKKSELGALFGIVFAKAINGDIMEFGTNARYIHYSLNEHSMDFAAGFHEKNQVGHGTDFPSIFKTANKKYDRVLIFSDMQGWRSGGEPGMWVRQYMSNFGADPFIYSFDLAGYGSMMFPEGKVFALAGFSDKIFNLMTILEKDKKALLNEIKKLEI